VIDTLLTSSAFLSLVPIGPSVAAGADLDIPTSIWATFTGVVVALLVLDTVFSGKNIEMSFKDAVVRSLFWVSLGLGFNVWLWANYGSLAGQEFTACYLLEESLSVDNLFVFMIVLNYFKVPPGPTQHRVLFLGVMGAILMRGTLILLGIEMVERFHWILYIFAIILIVSGIKMGGDDDAVDPNKNFLVNALRRFMPVTSDYVGTKFFVREHGILKATPLFAVLLCIETTDLVFALDSIPAVFGVTSDHFVAFTSNIMAVLGLRALFFAVAGLMKYFRYLPTGLKIILVLIGVKMLLHEQFHLATTWLLVLIGAVLGISILASVIIPAPPEEEPDLAEIESHPS
jgi:tellurite resistance protein TerC